MTNLFRSRHLVSDDLVPMLEMLSSRDRSLTLEEQRKQTLDMLAASIKPRDGVRRSERFIPGPGGDLRVLIYEPTAARSARGGFLHIHGGGFVLGAPELGEDRNSLIAAELGHVVVSVAYRLAPEATYPAALEDCHAALVWLRDNASALKVDPKRIGIIGESAGGGHAAALSLLARDRGQVALSFQWLIYPMIDDRTGTTINAHPYAGEFVWTAENNRSSWTAMLGQPPGGTPPGPYAVPARAEDISGLPPTLLQTGALDLFCEENVNYANRLMRAGVPVELHVYAGAMHGFTLVADSRAGSEARREGFDMIKRLWG